MGDENPYQLATKANTNTDWLSDQTPVDVDIRGMGDFAQNMKTIQGNLTSELGYVDDLHTVPMKAWEGTVLAEAEFVRTRMSENATELTQYLQRLSTALLNIGMAAQTIADTYGATDGFSAIDLNAVQFAFAEPGAKRPAGLPSHVTGETYRQKLAAAQPAQQPQQPRPGTPAQPPGQGKRYTETVRTNPDGTQTVTRKDSDGKVVEQVRTAPQTDGAPPLRDSPRQRALDSIEGMY